eukprot:GCRY01005737.1.p1 GENE.GCRY01005737.1~~GCRY01005737.1.p1  ORF type:complete len:256 (-),score=23.56 GCRY01005737.1:23-790(-)
MVIDLNQIPRNIVYSFKDSVDGVNSNILILFHGLGDDHLKFSKFATSLELPQTASLAIRAPDLAFPLFPDMGYSWFPSFDAEGNLLQISPLRLNGLDKTRNLIMKVINAVSECEKIFLFGFSQGANLVIDLLLHTETRFGGCICISDTILDERTIELARKSTKVAHQTPVLVIHGKKDTTVPIKRAQKKVELLKNVLPAPSLVDFALIDAKGHEMVSSKIEAKLLMTFFSKHLYLRNLALERDPDIVEVKACERV